MIITFFSVLSFRFVYNVEINERDFIIPISYGFDVGGYYTIKIYNGSNDSILLHLGTINDFKQFWIDKNLYDPCNVSNAVSNDNIHIIQNQNTSFSGVINKAGKYTINVKSCTLFNSKYTIELIFQNPKSNLSSESQFYLKTFEFQLFYIVFLSIIWIISIIHSHTKFNIFKIIITVLLLLFIIDKNLLVFDYKSRNQTDEISQISIIRPYFEYIFELFFYNTIVLIISGYQFTFDHLPIFLLICNFTGCLVLVYLTNSLYFFIVLMIPFIYYMILNIYHIKDNENVFVYFTNYIVLLLHSLLTFFIRKESLTRFDIQSILNYIDISLLSFLLYQFHFNEKISLFHLNKIQSSFNEFINKKIGKTVVIKSNIAQLNNPYNNYLDYQKLIYNAIFQSNSKLQLIGNWVFSETNIKTIKIPSSVIIIGENAFSNCPLLQTVEFEGNSSLQIIGYNAFSNSSINKILIPSSVIEIHENAFLNCKNLTKVEFEKNSQLQKIENHAFASTSIINIEIPSNVVCLESNVFLSCKQLVKVTFSTNSQLIKISEYAFSESSIQYLEIPSKASILERNWSFNTLFLKYVIVSPENEYFVNINENIIVGKQSYNKDILYFVSRDTIGINIPFNIKHIDTCTFSNSELRYADFDNGSQLTVVRLDAFCYSRLECFSLPSTVTTIETRAFGFCHFLKVFNFQKNSQLTFIGDYAFIETLIFKISIPSKVKYIGNSAFYNCNNLGFVDFSNDSELEIIGDYAFGNTSLTQFSIPHHVIKIGDYAFDDCRQLQIIEIPEESKLKLLNNNIINEYSNTIVMIPFDLHISII